MKNKTGSAFAEPVLISGAKWKKVEPLDRYGEVDSSTTSDRKRHSLNIYPISKNEVSTAEGQNFGSEIWMNHPDFEKNRTPTGLAKANLQWALGLLAKHQFFNIRSVSFLSSKSTITMW